MANWCLIPEYVDKVKNGLRDGSINPEKLSKMASEERNKYLSNFVGKDNASQINALFESKLLLKNQKAGYISWAKKLVGMTPQAKRDLISKIEKMDKILNPEDGQAFLKDLAQTRLGANVTEQEAKQVFDLSTKVREARALQKEDFTFATEAERLAYGRSKIALTNYVNDLKEKTYKEVSLNPVDYLSNVAGNAKSIKASLDNSAIFRQGWKTLMTNPLTWSKNASRTFSDIVKTFGGKKVMDEINADIISRPSYDLMVKAKLAIGTIEEAFPGTIAEKIPVLSRVYKASENAYTGFLYRQRADIFDKYIQIAQKTGVELTNKELQSIGSMVNSLTGRGNLGKFEGSAANLLNNLFFSPRNFKSQFDTLGHVVTGAGGSNFVRKQAAINLVKVISGTAAILATANAVKPGSVEWDPRSSDFGQIKVGNTRFNVSGGLNSLVTLASRLITMETKSSTTGAITPLNSGDFGALTGKDVVYNFFENKLSPVASVVKDLLRNEDFDGNAPTPLSVAKSLFVPIGFSTFEELKKDPQAPNIIMTMILDGLGIGANTYAPKEAKPEKWSVTPTKSQSAFQEKVDKDKFNQANEDFNSQYAKWFANIKDNPKYQSMSKEEQQSITTAKKADLQEKVFKSYGFTYKEPKVSKSQKKKKQKVVKELIK